MSDTPYLLRMEMLKIAQQRASEKYQAQLTIANCISSIQENSNPLNDLASYPSIEDILEEARKLKAFVDGK